MPAATDQEQFLPYWTTEPGWESEIQLRNNQLNKDLKVTITLRSSSGAETTLQTVTVKPRETVIADVATALRAMAPQLLGRYGSVVLHYKAPTEMSLFSMAMLHATGKPLALHIDSSSELPAFQKGSREGIWWLPASTTTNYLVLANQGQMQLQLALSLYDATGRAFLQIITLPARAMVRYSLRELIAAGGLSGSYGGITLSTGQNAGSLDTLEYLADEKVGFSALLKMYDHNPNVTITERDFAKTGLWTLRAPMLALSNPDAALEFPGGTLLQPKLLVRNTTAKPTDASVSFQWKNSTNSGSAAGPSLHLSPYQTQEVDVAALQQQGVIPITANWASVKLTTSARPGDLMALASSYDKTLTYGAQTPVFRSACLSLGRQPDPLPFSVTNETRVLGRLKFISPDFMLVSRTLEPLTTS